MFSPIKLELLRLLPIFLLLLVPYSVEASLLKHTHDHDHGHGHGHDHDHDQAGYIGCGTPELSQEELVRFEARLDQYSTRSAAISDGRSSRIAAPRAKLCIGCVFIDVYFHVILDTQGKSLTSLLLTDTNIALQVEVLNQHFNNTPFRFLHKMTTRTINDEWVYGVVFEKTGIVGGGRATGLAIRISGMLRKGGPDTINVFFVDGGPDSRCPANFASFPNELGMFPNGTYSRRDSIFICPGSIAKSNSPNNALRATAVTHEIGHWLGLFHTFGGTSCDPSNLNDLVDDTPQQLLPSSNCATCCLDAGRDSCPLLPGKDPSRNFMDYSSCTSEFTPGQIERMYNIFNDVRRRVEPCGSNEFDVHVEIRYDDDPRGFLLNFTSWTTSPIPRTLTIGNNVGDVRISLVNETVARDMCLPKHKLHEFKVVDKDGGFKAPGYFTISMNGMVLVNVSNFSTNSEATTSFLLSGDRKVCDPSQRIQLTILFDDNPSAITWKIRRVTDNVIVASEKMTTSVGAKAYQNEFAGSILFFDVCLPKGDYVFTILDSSPFPTGSPSYFSLSRLGKEFYRGGKNGGRAKEVVQFSVAAFTIGCFSGESTVRVAGKGQVAIRSVRIGDQVQVENGKFEPVYSFGHSDSSSYGTFLQLHLSNGKNVMLSHDHLIFTAANSRYPIPASEITIGTELVDAHRLNTVFVKSITPSVKAKGIFAPFTPSGTVVVDGILASSFVAMGASSSSPPYIVSFGGLLGLSHQWLAHSFEFPHRVACYYYKYNSNNDALSNQSNKIYNRFNYCPAETYTHGVATQFITPLKVHAWFVQQHFLVRGILLVMLAILFCVFQIVEACLVFCNNSPVVAGVMMIMTMMMMMMMMLFVVAKKGFDPCRSIQRKQLWE